MRILLVEDEPSLSKTLKLNFEMDDFEVLIAEDGKVALKMFYEQHFDLVILDLMLPSIDGIQVCQQIRLTNLEIPILILSARDSPDDRILGLKTGADDYLAKPFTYEELLLRIQKLLKRSSRTPDTDEEIFRFGENEINFITHEAKCKSGIINLTKKEIMLLKLLVDRKNQVVSRNQILRTVWGYEVFPSTRTIDNFMLSFRKYFEKDPAHPVFFHSVRGIGYKLVV
jgi:two-component system alkaline phosphatase synthesis response regulator PhoP